MKLTYSRKLELGFLLIMYITNLGSKIRTWKKVKITKMPEVTTQIISGETTFDFKTVHLQFFMFTRIETQELSLNIY